MDTEKVDKILKFALAVAGRRDTPRERELGPIHFIKLVYLADLAYAERHHGRTFTDAPWRFYHYGPWTEQVWERISPVMIELDAQERTFSSKYKEDHKRWSLSDSEQTERLIAEMERALPSEVTSAVFRGVREHGTDTTSLLHEVYRTRPMLGTHPGSPLRFDLAVLPPSSDAPPKEAITPPTPKQQKRRKEALRTLRERVQAKLQQGSTPTLVAPPTPPSYDEEFFEGVRWLDSLAGESQGTTEGQLHFSDELWSAPGREELE